MGGGGRLRIAFVADCMGAPVGGGVLSARQLVARLREEHDVSVIGADADGPGAVRLPGFVLPSRAMRSMGFVMARPDRDALRSAFARADVVHLQFPFWLSVVALREAHRAGLPVVAAFHVQPENAFLNFGVRWRWLASLAYRIWVRLLYGRADAVVCPTRFAERKLRAHGLAVPAYVISNGVPPDATATARLPRRAGAPFVIAAVGRLATEKRQDVLLEAVRRSRHGDRIHVVLAGAGPREAELRRLGAGLPGGVEVGFLDRAALLELLRRADLLVHCSEVELEGLAILEAMSVGLPVVVAQGPETAAGELALDGRFAFPAGDAGALAERIDALLDAPETLARAAVAYRRAARRLDFQASVERWIELYRSLLAPARGAAAGA